MYLAFNLFLKEEDFLGPNITPWVKIC